MLPVSNLTIAQLLQLGATEKLLNTNDYIFKEGEDAKWFFFISKGQVKMFNTNSDGREFTQGIFDAGCTFAEPPLMLSKPYPTTCVATKPTILFRLSKERFYQALNNEVFFNLYILNVLAYRVYNKAVTARATIINSPEDRLAEFLKYFKQEHFPNEKERVLIPHTRQEIANLNGLRVETVIRTLISMQAKGLVEIRNRKLYY